MIDYTIMEYNIETKKYTTIGLSHGPGPQQAKDRYIKEHDWMPRENIILFAKPPVCRYTFGLLVQLVRTPGS